MPDKINKDQYDWLILRKQFFEELKYSLILEIVDENSKSIFSYHASNVDEVLCEKSLECLHNDEIDKRR